ncbi:LysR family transcriptional regulator [Acinetobacter sp. 194]|uniref:LysR family transcriptional regulator n=1 Tax=Acinetobacter shaoyimingii TaxID=2715164 RepID=UPI0014087939|nr:LysR family transcriptional regulator [Acinetobacter shaoyimingii]NHB57954.1 LysR family transcriptional regulator [Acinetobacter shaoyimingii]
MDKIDCISTFISVVESGNFSKAAKNLGISRNQVAKRICYLEDLFKTSLFIRDTRHMNVTIAGKKFYQHCKIIMSEFEWAKNEFFYDQNYPEGRLTINAPLSYSQECLTNLISNFLQQYPSIKIDLMLTDRFVNLNEENFDLNLRISEDFDEVEHLKLSTHQRCFYATPRYFEQFGIPKTVEDLKEHNILFYTQPNLSTKITLQKNDQNFTIYSTPKLTCNNGEFLLECCKKNQGIVFLPDFIVQQDVDAGNIVKCLEDYQSNPLIFFAVTASNYKTSKNIKLFLDFLRQYYSK